jgi:uncharacterized protein YceH (UPF0502 family)
MSAGSRVEKYRHTAREALELSAAETAVLAELLMRGSQQPGELRARAARMSPLATTDELIAVLSSLAQKGFVRKHVRRSGERAERWGQTLAPEAHPVPSEDAPAQPAAASSTATTPRPAQAALEQRLAELEQRVAALERTLADLGG